MPLHMNYGYWMMVIGTLLVIIGFIGLAFRQNRKIEQGENKPETNEQGSSRPKTSVNSG